MRGEFTYERYRELLKTARANGYEFLTVREYLSRDDHPERFLLLRHDVDRKPENALDMARIEARVGATSTYYVRTKTFEPALVREMESLGHEVGYHYEDMDRADGDVERAHESFARNLADVRTAVTVDTVCMHGNPLTPHDNRDMWTDEDQLAEYDLLGEAYLSVDFTDVTYFSDTNRTWYDEKTIVDDWPVGPSEKGLQIDRTGDLIDLVASGRLDSLYVLSHPNRWADSYPELVAELTKDAVIDAGKWGLWMLDRTRGRLGKST